ncbi:hypothetical protein F4703DRAFT_1833148 [Phycomyces blakesleeanus]|uniref:CDT1 Geminin-binding domain-containing protein n=1 Tax=Phycomyces blakesleeanus (strain ATCC 8743b / DSM 1359 / FGSC 10004 / NBRC 33097 / NRRL 1555) TaxID=763407 RepID=A0A167PPC7_PHYB8|nr:hypothetical protein PHYBLDRAFT_179514 [Phycomyces blakesleeanus NRRL 1555(-)]OAD78297.1 hypothetical protein PHYBLDRAFT_179514 [Phycomyces blakesleeanus NRRL 1555(-)]|eukprot:XP_018296337.1 hypothetical protein PHYBLDRAFT_179514 [Phycomyces blakesleeanus NRRL 1555(-)]
MQSRISYPVQKRALGIPQDLSQKQRVAFHQQVSDNKKIVDITVKNPEEQKHESNVSDQTRQIPMSFLPTNNTGIELPRRKSGRLASRAATPEQKTLFDIINPQEKTPTPTPTTNRNKNNIETEATNKAVGKSVNILPRKNALAQQTLLNTTKRAKKQHVNENIEEPIEILQTENNASIETYTVVAVVEKEEEEEEEQQKASSSIEDTSVKAPEIKERVEATFVEPQTIISASLSSPIEKEIPLNVQIPILDNNSDAVKAQDQQESIMAINQTTTINTDNRIEDEKLTLTRLRDALDIKLTFHAAQNQPVIFHKIQQSLCNSTRKNISLSHIAKLIYLAPELYTIQAKALRELGRTIEAYLLEFGSTWIPPLSGKSLQDRKEILASKIKLFFGASPKSDVSVPEAELPKIDTIVNKDKWLERANLPASVRAVLEKQEQRKEATLAAQGPKQTPVGTVKDRASALLERLRAKAAAKKK